MPLSRRDFFQVAGVVGLGAGVASLSACSSVGNKTSDQTSDNTKSRNIVQTYDYDIVIVGGGVSGLAAAVQAGQNGLKTALLEANAIGGNGMGVEGIFAVGSSAQKAQGIEIDPCKVIVGEIAYTQMRSDGLIWMDLIKQSAENYEWLVDNGVKFSGVIDDYRTGGPRTMHWFDGFASEGYAPYMQAAAEKAGVEFYLGFKGDELIMDGDRVSGIYVVDDKKEDVQFNAPVVILATGGFGSNPDYIAQLGYNMDYLRMIGAPGHDGDGLRMAEAAGAALTIGDCSELAQNTIIGAVDRSDLYISLFYGGPYLWVNEKGERYTTEDVTASNFMAGIMPTKNQRCTYTVFTRDIFETFTSDMGFVMAAEQLDELIEKNENKNIYLCNTPEEAAEKFDLDTKTFEDSFNKYQTYCANGYDPDFGKDAKHLKSLGEGPYIIARLEQDFVTSIGGIKTNRSMEVVSLAKEPIPGLYAIGVDGCMLYRDVYSIDIPATCCGNNINSGRVAVNKAAEYITTL
ncbi:FAD-dependent oxidoreductase [Raoultibacter massiliensis]|uniref:FAD-dependent oxidoreductase n=1 Tax=Raoultibacter massiliensis TaxID=1852371 RepID=UPI003A8CB94C